MSTISDPREAIRMMIPDWSDVGHQEDVRQGVVRLVRERAGITYDAVWELMEDRLP